MNLHGSLGKTPGQPGWQLGMLAAMAGRRRARNSAGLLWPALLGLLLWLIAQAPWLAADAPINAPTAPPSEPTAPTESAKRAPRIPTVAVDPHSVWASAEACAEAIDHLLAAPRTDALRIASWNLHWFPDGRAGKVSTDGGTDVAWMACAMASLRADVIAIQEVTTTPRARTALLTLVSELERLTGGQWRDFLDDCNGATRQHLGFLYDASRVSLEQLRTVGALNPLGNCKRLRPGVAGRLRVGTTQIDLVTVHLDSGETENDYTHRLQSVRSLIETFNARATTPVLALGDFNTMGCSQCALPADVEEEVAQLQNMLSPAGYRAIGAANTQAPCSEHFHGKPQLLDRALTTLPAKRVRLEMAGLCAELSCQRPRTTSAALSRLSDHCPIVVEVTRAN